jgi:uncharacterized integral membrane protein
MSHPHYVKYTAYPWNQGVGGHSTSRLACFIWGFRSEFIRVWRYIWFWILLYVEENRRIGEPWPWRICSPHVDKTKDVTNSTLIATRKGGWIGVWIKILTLILMYVVINPVLHQPVSFSMLLKRSTFPLTLRSVLIVVDNHVYSLFKPRVIVRHLTGPNFRISIQFIIRGIGLNWEIWNLKLGWSSLNIGRFP